MKQLFFKPISVPIDDMDRFEQNEKKKNDILKTLGMIG